MPNPKLKLQKVIVREFDATTTKQKDNGVAQNIPVNTSGKDCSKDLCCA
jgi:hypothetical protein